MTVKTPDNTRPRKHIPHDVVTLWQPMLTYSHDDQYAKFGKYTMYIDEKP